MQKDRVQAFFPVAIAIVFCAGCFFYLWLRIDPSLYYMAQEPIFQVTASFLEEYLSYPGGIVDYASTFLSQSFVYPMVSAVIIAIVLFLISYATLHLLRLTDGKRVWYTAHLFPAAFCITLQNNYYNPLSITIGLALALLAFNFYGYQKTRRLQIRLPIFFTIACVLYYCAAGALLLYAILCLLYETINERRIIAGCVYGVIAAVIPFFAEETVFLISVKNAYLHILPFDIIGYNPRVMLLILYAFFPVLFVFAIYDRILPGKKFTQLMHNLKLPRFVRVPIGTIISGVLIITVCATTTTVFFSRVDNISLRFCLMSRQGARENILNEFPKTWLDNRVANYAVGQALYATGLLPTHLFSFPQHYGERGLFLFGDRNADYFDQDAFFFMYRCELFLKLGLVNEAQQWGYESLGLRGETPWSLQRLAQIHALKGEFPAALTCLSILETMPFHKTWARHFQKQMSDQSFIASDETLQAINRSMPTTDFIRKSCVQPCLDLEEAVRQNPNNRMTFEYCMASYLLLGNLPKIASLIGYLDTFGYPAIPRLYEEALVMLKAVDYPQLPAITGRINQKTIDDYVRFNLILKKYNGNFGTAEKEILEKYWNSFWYYCFYTLPTVVKNTAKK